VFPAVYEQDAAAETALASADTASIPSYDALIHPIDLQLRLPSICTHLPAYRAALTGVTTD
jgi:hypothetical protein